MRMCPSLQQTSIQRQSTIRAHLLYLSIPVAIYLVAWRHCALIIASHLSLVVLSRHSYCWIMTSHKISYLMSTLYERIQITSVVTSKQRCNGYCVEYIVSLSLYTVGQKIAPFYFFAITLSNSIIF